MYWIVSKLLAVVEPEEATPFDLVLKSFREHFEDQRSLLPILGIALLIAAVIAVDILVGLRLARGSKPAPKKRHTS